MDHSLERNQPLMLFVSDIFPKRTKISTFPKQKQKMCKCTPEIRTPWCGKPGCENPYQPDEKPGDLSSPEPKVTELNEQVALQVRKLVLEGKSYVEIRLILGINENTWDSWVYRDTQGFRKQLTDWNNERMVKKARRNLEEMLDMPIEVVVGGEFDEEEDYDDEVEESLEPQPHGGSLKRRKQYVKTDPALVRIKQDTSKFVTERLEKESFAQRNEQTGKGGGPIEQQITGFNYIVPNEPNAQTDLEATPSVANP